MTRIVFTLIDPCDLLSCRPGLTFNIYTAYFIPPFSSLP